MGSDGKIWTAIGCLPTNYGEVLTEVIFPTGIGFAGAVAFLYFKKMKTNFTILETGLGGRCDATNAADAKIAAITPISFEHTAGDRRITELMFLIVLET